MNQFFASVRHLGAALALLLIIGGTSLTALAGGGDGARNPAITLPDGTVVPSYADRITFQVTFDSDQTNANAIEVIFLNDFTEKGKNLLQVDKVVVSPTSVEITISGIGSSDITPQQWIDNIGISDGGITADDLSGRPSKDPKMISIHTVGFHNDVSQISHMEAAAIQTSVNNGASTFGSPVEVTSFDASRVNVAPNPSQGRFRVTIDQTIAIDKIVVMNIIGKVVFTDSQPQATTNIELNNAPAGVYFVQIQSGEKVVVKRLVLDK